MRPNRTATRSARREMQTGWEGRGRRIVEKDCPVIKRDLVWEAGGTKRAPQCQLIPFERRTGGAYTGIALDLEAADAIKDVDQAHFPNAIHHHPPLGIEFPFVVRVGMV